MLREIQTELYHMKHAVALEGRDNPKFVIYTSFEVWDAVLASDTFHRLRPARIDGSTRELYGCKVYLVDDEAHGFKIYEDRLLLYAPTPGGNVRAQFAKD